MDIVIMFLLLLVPVAIVGQWWLFAVFMIFGVIFGIVELICKKKTDKTISQLFREWSEENKKKGWTVLGCMLASWLILLAHLARDMF